jgi:hypothetical protein
MLEGSLDEGPHLRLGQIAAVGRRNLALRVRLRSTLGAKRLHSHVAHAERISSADEALTDQARPHAPREPVMGLVGHAPALTAMFKQIIANNRAGGWHKLKRES